MYSLHNLLFVATFFSIIFQHKNPLVEATDKSCSLLADYSCPNDQPCTCGTINPFCQVCQDEDTVPCSQCQSGYFSPGDTYKCVECQELLGDTCVHCTNGRGCQQCSDSSIQPHENSCGLYTCEQDEEIVTTDIPSNGPTVNPTVAPSRSPTIMPSMPPTNFSNIDDVISDEANDLLRGEGDNTLRLYDNSSSVCINPIICGGKELVIKLFGICDLNAIVSIRETIYRYDTVFYHNYLACDNSKFGLFWINGIVYTKYNAQNDWKIESYAINLFQETNFDALRYYLIDGNGNHTNNSTDL